MGLHFRGRLLAWPPLANERLGWKMSRAVINTLAYYNTALITTLKKISSTDPCKGRSWANFEFVEIELFLFIFRRKFKYSNLRRVVRWRYQSQVQVDVFLNN